MSTIQNLVIIGSGMATARLLPALVDGDANFNITVIGEEPHSSYNRILLSSLLAGEKALADLPLLAADFYREHGIRCLAGTRALGIDRARQLVTTDRGLEIPYDHLVLATGSRPCIPTIPGRDLEKVRVFRSIADVENLQQTARKGGHAVVIGGGLLGLEAAVGLAGAEQDVGLKPPGMTVTVLQRAPWLMNRQLDETAGGLLARALSDRGVDVMAGVDPVAVNGEGAVEAVELSDGRRVQADLVVFATGIVPNIELAREAHLDCDRGVMVGDDLATSDPAISAIGECCQHRGVCYGLVAPVWQQADVLAHNLANPSAPPRCYTGSVVTTRLKVSGIDVFSAGEFDGNDAEEQVFFDPIHRVYRRLRLRDGQLVGAVLYGDRRDGSWYADLVEQGASVASFQNQLMFGRSCCETAGGSATRSAA